MTRRLRRREVLGGIAGAGAAGLAGCTGGNGGGSGRTIKMGLLMGVTGGLSDLGPPIRNAAQLVPQQVNDADSDFEVDVQFEDTATAASQGVSGGNALVNGGYPMICGALSSEVSLQVANQVAIPNGVTMCSPASTAPDFTTLDDNDYFFRTPPTDALQGQVLAQIASERQGHSSAATLYLNNAYGNGLSAGFADAFENEYGGSVTASVSFSEGQNSYSSQLSQALGDDPDVLVVVGYPGSGVTIFRDYYNDYGADRDILVSDGLQSADLPGNVGRSMRNVTGTAPLGEGPGVDFFSEQFQNTYDSDPAGQPFTRQSYDAAAVLVLANAAAGENSGAAVRDNVRTVAQGDGEEITPSNLVDGIEMAASGDAINYQGVSGPVAFDDNGDLAAATYEYFEFTDSGVETVETITP
ncbi:ABC transporter substrate-binding protein [Halorientalis pallida]|uniref:ABC transporter substrate-binding protein n=1 Tax=Halorientalis pallida TaxID=2479928 RepID=A0A498KY20_9EURY|nr:ABC transporter substrate-binding protein [Halorientalis pallida]RXK50239.1 ABC transporter substrate-binding protein [Halorientalis pallida]